jgi:hypothetical protein
MLGKPLEYKPPNHRRLFFASPTSGGRHRGLFRALPSFVLELHTMASLDIRAKIQFVFRAEEIDKKWLGLLKISGANTEGLTLPMLEELPVPSVPPPSRNTLQNS